MFADLSTSSRLRPQREDKERIEAITSMMDEIRQVVSAKEFEGVRVIGNTIDFGPRGRFEKEGQNTLSPPQRDLIRQFTPKFLDKLRTTDAGKRWFKRAVVEGYASQSGKYLFNLNLSLERSARVLCELLRDPPSGEEGLSGEDRRLVATKFFVGGASFNSLRSTADDSRRSLLWRNGAAWAEPLARDRSPAAVRPFAGTG